MTIEVNHINLFKWPIKQWFSVLAMQSHHLWDLKRFRCQAPIPESGFLGEREGHVLYIYLTLFITNNFNRYRNNSITDPMNPFL